MAGKFVQSTPLARFDDGKRFYGTERAGVGRWFTVPQVGILWTNDTDATQVRIQDGTLTDPDAGSALALWLVEMATRSITAADAFDTVAANFPQSPITTGNLSALD